MDSYKQIDYLSADELWESLSPTRSLDLPTSHTLFYRGQGNASWGLLPASLRSEHISNCVVKRFNLHNKSNGIVVDEIFSLIQFIHHCDRTGIKIPNDCNEFRKQYADLYTEKNINSIKQPTEWPNYDLLELMALAQHHGVPTRLLDWTTLPYTACYFAASSALNNFQNWKDDSKLAIWALDTKSLIEDDLVIPFKPPGSITPYLAAQYGAFTVHPHNEKEGGGYDVLSIEKIVKPREKPIILKLTIPSYQAARLLRLCCISGFSAADIYPSIDGVGKAVLDDRNIQAAIYFHKQKGKEIKFTDRIS
ncbi:hypothetical protein C9426_19680 [Serratia sp. S1B]|nr:hypothetical protein C9426_19680 [Serratia sp. S1B]